MTRHPRFLEFYIGDGAYVYLSSLSEVVFHTSDGVTEKNVVVIDTGDLKGLIDWLSNASNALAHFRETKELPRARY